MRCTELVRENTDAPIVKSGEVWNLLGVQLTQHQKSAAAKDTEMVHGVYSVQSSGY